MTRPREGDSGESHAETVERNICRLLYETTDFNLATKRAQFSAQDLYLLSCAACCHDFDKGLSREALEGEFQHGEGSGAFVKTNSSALGITEQAAYYVDKIISIHDAKDSFDEVLQGLDEFYQLADGHGNLRCLATLLKAGDSLHMDASRISRLGVKEDGLADGQLRKHLFRSSTFGWRADGSRIIVTVKVASEEAAKAVQESIPFFKNHEWNPIARNLKAYGFPGEIHFEVNSDDLWSYDKGQRKAVGVSVARDQPFHTEEPYKSGVRASGVDALRSSPALKLIAVPVDRLAEVLCQSGRLSVIGNPYIEPDFRHEDHVTGAVNCLFVGPANCGKTRAAYEWIVRKVGPDAHAWLVLLPQCAGIPPDVGSFVVDFAPYCSHLAIRPDKAILFAENLPLHLERPGSGSAASEVFHRLLEWFRACQDFPDRRFVGTIRTERIDDEPGWPHQLSGTGEYRLLRVQPLDEGRRRDLWKGISVGRAFGKQEIHDLNIEIEDGFIEAVSPIAADPEAIASYVREMALQGKRRITAEDSRSFRADAARNWINQTWPTVRRIYGKAAAVFLALARFIEPAERPDSGFVRNLYPAWEYHDAFGPPLLEENGGQADDYALCIKRMMEDGHAHGVEGDRIRPRFDFLLQSRDLEDVDLPAQPPAEWFARHAHNLSPDGQRRIAFHLACTGQQFSEKEASVHWLQGQGLGIAMMAETAADGGAERYEEALAVFEKLERRFGGAEEPEVREEVVQGLLNKGYVLGKLGRDCEALGVYDELDRQFGTAAEPGVRKQVANGLFNKGVTLGELGREEEELAAYDELVLRFGGDQEVAVRELVAKGMVNKAILSERIRGHEEAAAVYEDLDRRFGTADEPGVREAIARGLFNKGVIFGRLFRDENELAAYCELESRFGNDQEVTIRELVAKGMVNKAIALGRFRGHGDGVEVYEQLERRFADADEPVIRETIARGLLNKGAALDKLGRDEEACAAYEEVVRRYGDDSEPGVLEAVANGLFNKGVTLGKLGREQEELAAYDELVLRFGSGAAQSGRQLAAKGLFNKGVILARLGRPQEALATYDDLVGRFKDDEEVGVREFVAKGLINKGVTLGTLGRGEQAQATYDQVVDRFGADEVSIIREALASALFNKAVDLGRLGCYDEALAAYEDLVRRFKADQVVAIRQFVAMGLVNKGAIHGMFSADQEAQSVYDELVRQFGLDEEPSIREAVARGLFNMGISLGSSGRYEEELGAYDELMLRFGEDSEPTIREVIAKAHVNKGFALGKVGRHEEEQATYEELERRFGNDEQPGVRQAVANGQYNLACTLAVTGKASYAFSFLEAVLLRGEISWSKVAEDSDWDAVRTDPHYKRLEMKYRCGGLGHEDD